MNKAKEELLPIGTVVLLKDATIKMMINGFYVFNEEDNKLYDYSGCIYPEGLVDLDNLLVFNHDDIDNVVYKGYSSEEDNDYKMLLESTLELVDL